MLCTDIRIPAGEPELAFIKAWNLLVDEYEYHLTEWTKIMRGDDLLMAYRLRALKSLIEKFGRIEIMNYELTLKMLDHIEIKAEQEMKIIFFDGTRV